jgi:hypothetical protein
MDTCESCTAPLAEHLTSCEYCGTPKVPLSQQTDDIPFPKTPFHSFIHSRFGFRTHRTFCVAHSTLDLWRVNYRVQHGPGRCAGTGISLWPNPGWILCNRIFLWSEMAGYLALVMERLHRCPICDWLSKSWHDTRLTIHSSAILRCEARKETVG